MVTNFSLQLKGFLEGSDWSRQEQSEQPKASSLHSTPISCSMLFQLTVHGGEGAVPSSCAQQPLNCGS